MLKKLIYYNLLIPQGFIHLCIANWQVHHQKFKKLNQQLGDQQAHEHCTATLSDKQKQELKKIAITIRKLGKVFGFKCLAQAIAAQRLLKQRKIPSQLYLGVHKNQSELKAHAWLKCGEHFITGKKGSEHFTTVITYHAVQP